MFVVHIACLIYYYFKLIHSKDGFFGCKKSLLNISFALKLNSQKSMFLKIKGMTNFFLTDMN